jgi:hypothetical protein
VSESIVDAAAQLVIRRLARETEALEVEADRLRERREKTQALSRRLRDLMSAGDSAGILSLALE